VAERQGNMILQFSADLELGLAFFRDKKFDVAIARFLKAKVLPRPSRESQELLDKKSLLEFYTLLHDCYHALHQPIDDLVALENAVLIAAELEDPISSHALYCCTTGASIPAGRILRRRNWFRMDDCSTPLLCPT